MEALSASSCAFRHSRGQSRAAGVCLPRSESGLLESFEPVPPSMVVGTIRSHEVWEDLSDSCFPRSRRLAWTVFISRRRDRLCRARFFLLFYRHPNAADSRPRLRKLRGLLAEKKRSKCRGVRKRPAGFCRCRGQMTHAGLAVMAVKARLGPA